MPSQTNAVEQNTLLDNNGNANNAIDTNVRLPLIERIFTPKTCVVMFTLVNLFTYFDRGAISATLSHIRSDSKIAGDDGVISETKGGLIVSVFMIGYMIACPIFASLGKWVSVRVLVAAGLAIWAVACFVSGLAQSYTMLLLTRMMVGVGEASFSGFFVTILDNIAPKAQRTMWIGIFYCMIPTGTALGMAACGAISSLEWNGISGWRLSFFLEVIVAAPFVIFCCMFPSKYAPTSVGTEAHSAVEAENNADDGVADSRRGYSDDAASLATATRNSSVAATTGGSKLSGPGSSLSAAAGPNQSRLSAATQGSLQAHEDVEDAAVDAAVAAAPHPDGETGAHHHRDHPVDKAYADPITAVKHLLCNVDYLLICCGYGMYVFVTGALAVWAISMLTTGPWHMTDVAASSTIGGIVAITGLVGSICGGLFVDKMGGSQGAVGVFKCLSFNSAMMTIALPFGIGAMFCYNVGGFVVLFIIGVFFVFTITAPVNASILSSVRHDVRTYAMSFSTLFIHLIGDFPSPTVAGAIADSFDNGCSAKNEEWLCKNATATNDCFWVAATKNTNGHCVNEFETRNAMVITFSFIAFSVPVWMIAAIRARRRAAREKEEADRLERDGIVNPSAREVALHTEES